MSNQQSPFRPACPTGAEDATSKGDRATANGKCPTSRRDEQRRGKQTNIERAAEIFEDELAEPSSLRRQQDESVAAPKNNGKRRATRLHHGGRNQKLRTVSPVVLSHKPISCCYCLVSAIVVLVIVSLILVIVSYNENDEYLSQNDDESYTSTSVNIPIHLPPPPANIRDHCNIDRILEPAGRQTCQEICSRAECCQHSYRSDRACWRDNQAACSTYHEACVVLEPLSPESESTRDQYPSNILLNAFVLWENPNLIRPAPSQLAELCQAVQFFGGQEAISKEEVYGASMTCHEICNTARCCWDRSLTNAADRCWTNPECPAYQEACEYLVAKDASVNNSEPTTKNTTTDKTNNNMLKPVPSNVEALCQLDIIQVDLRALLACQQICLPAECCWNPFIAGQCQYVASDATCKNYRATCDVLNTPFNSSRTVTDVKQQVTTVDKNDQNSALNYSAKTIRDACFNHNNFIATATGHVTLCEQVCQPGVCCFSPNARFNAKIGTETESSSCPLYLPFDFCEKYASCEIVLTPLTPSNAVQVQQACSNLSDLSDCVNICARATCCFTNNPWRTCAVVDKGSRTTRCEEFQACEVLYQGLSAASDGGNQRNLRALNSL